MNTLMMKAKLLVGAMSLLCGIAAASVATAAEALKLPSGMPPFGKDKPLTVPKITKKVLPNGLEVWFVPRNGLPRVDFVLAVRGAGYVADNSSHPGFASMMAGLLNEGTQKRDSRAIAEAAQGYGGSVGGSTGHDGMIVSAYALASSAEPMMRLLAEVARQPLFSTKEVELAKANALQALKVSEATPRFRAERALGAAIYGEHSYGHIEPTAEAISSVTPELLAKEHAKRFRPDRSLLVITGRIAEGAAIKMAIAALGDWKAAGAPAAEISLARASAEPVRILLQRAGSVQSTVRLGRPGLVASGPDYVPLRLTSTILGGGFSSRINLNLREQKGYTYGASAGARSYRLGGGIIGGADVRNAVTGASIKEFMDEYRRIGTELVGAEEMDMNKRYVAGTYLVTTQMQRAVAETLANNWLIGLPAEFLGEYVPRIQRVSAEQVRDMGKKYFSPNTQTIVVVGEKDAIADQLKEFGEFSVVEK